ncbi:MAG: class I SAM-dependent rRNA methyltransferase [Planctomycetes bacterium]|nr:class I SAM-dependent rRNA methyltransferase [Planctomycetota bacterium]
MASQKKTGGKTARLPELRLKIRVNGRHPWFYRKMIGKPETPLPAGTPAKVRDRDGRLVGTGFYNPRAELALRMFSDGVVEDAKAHFVEALRLAVQLREQTLGLPKITDAYRLIHAEGDGFPGLVLDRLGNAIVAQVASLGMKEQLEPLGEWLLRHYQNSRLVLLQDKDWAEREGMDKLPRPAVVTTTVREHGLSYAVEAGTGHKTGFFADQRDNRLLLRQFAKGRAVLDLCCNSGGFAMNAVAGGAAKVIAADLDEAMVEQTRHNAATNKQRLTAVHGDAFDLLREAQLGAHDLIVLDPPKWVFHKDEIEAGLARYADLNRLGIEKVARGGLVLTCSCSGSVSEDQFLRMLRDAAAMARRDVRVLTLRGAGADHPVALECQETRYLKVALLQVR